MYRMPVVGVGTIRLLMNIAIPNPKLKVLKSLVLYCVLHASESQESLILVPYLTERGINVRFDQVGEVITEQHGVERTARRVDRIYVIDKCNDDSKQGHVVIISYIHLWHRRLGHPDHDMITILDKTITGMPEVKKVNEQERCVYCLLWKMRRLSFPGKPGGIATQPLEIVSVYLCEPMSMTFV